MASPFDPYLNQMLAWGERQPSGFSHPAIVSAMVDDAGWQAAFAEAVFTSARVRGLVGPHYGTRSRGRIFWQVTRQGQSWLDGYQRAGADTSESRSPSSAHPTAAETTDPA